MQIPLQPVIFDTWGPTGRTLKQDYYLRRDAAPGPTSWAHSVDPDGRVRHRLSEVERLQWLDDMAEEIAWLRSLPPSRMIDVGCGPGWLIRAMPATWDCMGVEIARDAVDELRRHGIPSVRELSELPEGVADVVVAYHVIEHMTYPERQLSEMRKRLRKGGWLLLGTPDFASPCAVRFGDNYRMLHDRTHVSLFTLESLYRFARDHGFRVVDMQFPFPPRYATPENFMRWHDTTHVSPPWPGNWVTLYCQRT